ncbi:hypothetical protein HYU18_04285 [Candidatus Woesearchaeota archaeon]|nr:hypothetical protein [Candidatus Woesearchaeota archaeon]
MSLVVKTNIVTAVKEVSRKRGYSVKSISGDFLKAANDKVLELVEKAVERAHSNNRKTVMGKDI